MDRRTIEAMVTENDRLMGVIDEMEKRMRVSPSKESSKSPLESRKEPKELNVEEVNHASNANPRNVSTAATKTTFARGNYGPWSLFVALLLGFLMSVLLPVLRSPSVSR